MAVGSCVSSHPRAAFKRPRTSLSSTLSCTLAFASALTFPVGWLDDDIYCFTCCWADTAYNQDGHLCGAHFSRALYKCLLDLPLHYNDFETDDPALWSGMVQFVLATDNIAEQSEAVVEGGLRFAEEVYSTSDPTRLLETVELQPNGQPKKKKHQKEKIN